jgi:hypothetical protein
MQSQKDPQRFPNLLQAQMLTELEIIKGWSECCKYYIEKPIEVWN